MLPKKLCWLPDSDRRGDDIVICNGVLIRSQDSFILLQAGDNLLLKRRAALEAAREVILRIDHGNADPGRGGIVQAYGKNKR